MKNQMKKLIGLGLCVVGVSLLRIIEVEAKEIKYFEPTQIGDISEYFEYEGESYYWEFTNEGFKLRQVLREKDFRPTKQVELSSTFQHEGKQYQWLWANNEFKLLDTMDALIFVGDKKDSLSIKEKTYMLDEYLHVTRYVADQGNDEYVMAGGYGVHEFEGNTCKCGYSK